VGADGVDLGSETIAGAFDGSPLCVPGDDRELVAVGGSKDGLHVLEP
jgi:hypothetical protein